MDDPAVSPPGTSRLARWWPAGGVGFVVAAVGIALAARWAWPETVPQPDTDPFPLPPISASPYRNTGQDARYVGSDACTRCHEAAHESFRRTGMGRSMAEADAGREPPGAAFDHPASKRRYQVRRDGGRVWHRELLLTAGPAEVVLAEYPLKYVVGSGRHSLTYLVEADGFLVESPVTWYASRKAWGMSPGYDGADQPGFRRAVTEDCLFCHAGRSEAVERSLHRIHVAEPAIGCERCHGPGSLHLARHAGLGRPAPGAIDDTIVNPAHLNRELSEAVCQQCHLRPTAVVPVRGRKLSDFRPGLPLTDFQLAYLPDAPDGSMTVVGHVEQMHLSRCYQASGTLTCLTCHDPHGEPKPEAKAAYYNAVCAGCHKPEACKVDPARRAQEGPADDCVHCHMPTAPTDIPHLAFTHHRIGVHRKSEPPPAGSGGGGLRPFSDVRGLSEPDRQRSVGLAYLMAADQEPDATQGSRYLRQALELLTAARAAGLRDPTLDASLARLRSGLGLGDVLPYAEAALADPDVGGRDRCTALFLLGKEQLRDRRPEDALGALRQLTRARRDPTDWLLMADCERALGHPAAAEEAAATAARIEPRLWQVHGRLADYYQRLGNPARADWHRQRAVP